MTLIYALRSVLFYLLAVPSMIAVGIAASVLGLFMPRAWVMRNICIRWCDFIVAWVWLCCGVHYRVLGREHIPVGACVVLSKHQSEWETLYLQSLFYPAATVLKQELLRVPFFGWGLSFFDPIAINRADRNNALKQVLRQGEEKLAQGRRVVIFPEGTRTLPGDPNPQYSVGGAMLATRARAQVLPVALNSGDCWPRNSLIKRPGTITVSIGAPIDASELNSKALNAQVQSWIETELTRIRSAR